MASQEPILRFLKQKAEKYRPAGKKIAEYGKQHQALDEKRGNILVTQKKYIIY